MCPSLQVGVYRPHTTLPWDHRRLFILVNAGRYGVWCHHKGHDGRLGGKICVWVAVWADLIPSLVCFRDHEKPLYFWTKGGASHHFSAPPANRPLATTQSPLTTIRVKAKLGPSHELRPSRKQKRRHGPTRWSCRRSGIWLHIADPGRGCVR